MIKVVEKKHDRKIKTTWGKHYKIINTTFKWSIMLTIIYISNSSTISGVEKSQFEDNRKASDFKGSCDTLNSLDQNNVNNRYKWLTTNLRLSKHLYKIFIVFLCVLMKYKINILNTDSKI